MFASIKVAFLLRFYTTNKEGLDNRKNKCFEGPVLCGSYSSPFVRQPKRRPGESYDRFTEGTKTIQIETTTIIEQQHKKKERNTLKIQNL